MTSNLRRYVLCLGLVCFAARFLGCNPQPTSNTANATVKSGSIGSADNFDKLLNEAMMEVARNPPERIGGSLLEDMYSGNSPNYAVVAQAPEKENVILTDVVKFDAGSNRWQNSLKPEELAAGWSSLFDGESLYGWEAASEADWKVVDGAITVSSGKPGLLVTTSDFGDYEFKCDFKAPEKTNSGIFLRTPLGPRDAKTDCYELNIAAPEVSPFSNGGFVGRAKATKYIPAQEWRTYDVSAIGGHFVVKIDGETVLDYTDPTPVGRGRIGLQLNSGEASFRNIKLKPAGLKSLFNGQDLSGWKAKDAPEMKSVFTVTAEKAINVKNGKGMLESEAQFGDFTLQFEVFSNGKHLNSGMFFRSIPGDVMNGYELQIQNGYKDGDRSQPLDCGTGGFYRRQNARKVVSDDFAWTHMTLVATGPHMAAWVNGVQVSDWTDTRAADPNPRKGLRVEPGTLIIQGHDPTTDLSFRNINAAEMPKR